MIFDFISGEASTQEGGEKFAKWLAEDADLTQKEKKSVVEKIKDFFNALDNAIDNRQRMLDGDTAQKNSTGEKTGARCTAFEPD